MTQSAKLASLGTSNGTSVIVTGQTLATTSGTAATLTGIPSWVKRVTIVLNSVANSDTNYLSLQLGSGSVQTTGYAGSLGGVYSGTPSSLGDTAANFYIANNVANTPLNGIITFINVGSNTWVMSGQISNNTARVNMSNGVVTLSGVLDRINLLGSSGGSFSAGSINILYE